MSDENLSDDKAGLKQRIDSLNQEIRDKSISGFSYLSRANSQNLDNFFNHVIENFTSRSGIRSDEASSLIGLEESGVPDALLATTLLVGSVVDLDVNDEDFISFGSNVVFSEEDKDVVKRLLQKIIGQKGVIKSDLDDSSLANEMIPSFRNISARVDIRISFNNNDLIERYVPIAIFFLSTDCEDDILFQASRRDVQKLREKLDEIERHLKISEQLAVVNDRGD